MNCIDNFSEYFDHGHFRIGTSLETNRSMVDALDSSGYSLLHWAAAKNDREAIFLLLDRYDAKIDISAIPSGYSSISGGNLVTLYY